MRDLSEHEKGNRKIEECLPESIEEGKIYDFLKKDQRNYWLHGEIPLIETRGREKLSRPRASIVILEATHFLDNGEVWTRGKYKVVEVFKDDGVKFEGLWRVGELDF